MAATRRQRPGRCVEGNGKNREPTSQTDRPASSTARMAGSRAGNGRQVDSHQPRLASSQHRRMRPKILTRQLVGGRERESSRPVCFIVGRVGPARPHRTGPGVATSERGQAEVMSFPTAVDSVWLLTSRGEVILGREYRPGRAAASALCCAPRPRAVPPSASTVSRRMARTAADDALPPPLLPLLSQDARRPSVLPPRRPARHARRDAGRQGPSCPRRRSVRGGPPPRPPG